MSRDDWYRNTRWDAAIEASFRTKLARARTTSRPQYLRIQASYLTTEHPTVALSLIDDYFKTGDTFHVSMAFCARAEAYQTLARVNDALTAYKEALEWEVSHPHTISTARTGFPKLVADHRLLDEYDYALDILGSRFTAFDHNFPETRYLWNGCCALFAHDMGERAEAREFAERALRAAAETQSPLRYHRTLGLVRDTSDEFGRRLERIARPSKLGWVSQLVRRD